MAEDKAKQESAETPETSPVESQTPEIDVSEEGEKEISSPESQEETKSPEEVTWESLKGNTQERIKQILRERDEAREKAARQAQEDLSRVKTPAYGSQPSQPGTVSDQEIQQAVETLKTKGGIVTKDDLYALMNQIQREKDHDKLETKYDGSGGLPKYDRQEVEDYMKRKNIWGNSEAAFRDMYFDEFVDAGRKVPSKKGAYTERPTASSTARKEPLTLETLKEQLTGARRMEVYEKLAKNPEKFDEIIAELSQG